MLTYHLKLSIIFIVGLFSYKYSPFFKTPSSSLSDFVYRVPPQSLIQYFEIPINISDASEIIDYLPKGYVKTGDIDYTVYIQQAIDENSKVILPDFPILINDTGLFLRDNTVLIFRKHSQILLSPSDKTNYGMLNIINADNVTIINPKLVGDKYEHLNDKGEWGMGINIINGSNIQVLNPHVQKCWGDGIYLGVRDGGLNKDITIRGGLIDDNRRNGISIISGNNILIEDIVLSNSSGTPPMAGIDLEPNHNHEELENIRIQRTTAFNNADAGFLIYLGSLLGPQRRTVSINLSKCVDYYSQRALLIPGLRNDYENDIEKLEGVIKIDQFLSRDSSHPFGLSSGNYTYTPLLEVTDFQISNVGVRDDNAESTLRDWMRSRRMILK